ncbi:MAG: hypothetical protein C5B49_08830 [Bdellovibrio sp.]|nr:MAG: hypothetical protein C5B49_08830 [Bdellovibrio sp.]
MVLKTLAILLMAFSFAKKPAFDSSAYDKAVTLFQAKKSDKALAVLERAYRFESPDLPLKVSALAAQSALASKRWRSAEQIADSALRANWPQWPPADASNPEVATRLKGMPRLFLELVQSTVMAKSQRYNSTLEDISGPTRESLKNEIRLNSEALAQTEAASESTQASLARVREHDELMARQEYRYNLSIGLSYWTWEDRPQFTGFQTGRSMVYTPCLGFSLAYANADYEWSGGGCYGAGRSDLLFADGHYDNYASEKLLAGFGSVLAKLADGRAGFGVEADFMDSTIGGKSSNGSDLSDENQRAALMIVGRFRLSPLEIKFKGGTIVSNPGAIWVVELYYPIFGDF